MTTTAAADTSSTGARTGSPVHPLYQTWEPVWRKLLHAYEGSGGFLNGGYLIPHPREWRDHEAAIPQQPTKSLIARRELARYENVAATLLDAKRSAIFRETIVRTVGDPKKDTPHPLEMFWENVDGLRTHITDYMAQAFVPAGIFGHVVHYMDRPAGPAPVTKAQEKQVYLRVYSPLDVTDWLVDDMGRLIAVKFVEAVQRKTIEEPAATSALIRERVVDETEWRIVRTGTEVGTERGEHRLGRIPVIYHYAKRRALSPFIGASVMGDPALYIDLYNLTSEMRHLLRTQTFGLLNIQLGTGDNKTTVEDAIAMIGKESGPSNVLFSPNEAKYIQPEVANIEVYQKERTELLRTIYRLASIPWEADSRDAEAMGSLKLKREDMNQVLAGYADECEKVEYEIAELWFRAQYGWTAWESEMEKANVVIRYPDTFDVTPFAEILEQAQAAVSLNMGATFMTQLRTRLVPKFLPDATPDQVSEIEKELQDIGKDEKEQGSLIAGGKVKEMIDRLKAVGGPVDDGEEDDEAAA